MSLQSSQLNSRECTSKGSLIMTAQYILDPGRAAAWDQLQMGNHQCCKATVHAGVIVGWNYITTCVAEQGRL